MADNEPYLMRSLELQGFRAYLQPKKFDFAKKNCLSIFAPNGNGKTSLIDALEFLFSEDGQIARLGSKVGGNLAGPLAMTHALAEEKGIKPCVSVEFSKGKAISSGSRAAGLGKRPQPEAARTVSSCFVVSPIIRGHELRGFVEAKTAELRYMEFGRWLGVGALVEAQKNLHELRKATRAVADDADAFGSVDREASRETDRALGEWTDDKVASYVNEAVLRPLDPALMFQKFDKADPAFAILFARRKAEEAHIGLSGLRHARNVAAAVLFERVDPETGARTRAGALAEFEEAARVRVIAAASEVAERDKAANSVFASVWNAAAPLFAEGVGLVIDCPICATPLSETRAASVDGARAHMQRHIVELEAYSKAEKAFKDATISANRARGSLSSALQALLESLRGGQLKLKEAGEIYLPQAEAWEEGDGPNSVELSEAIFSMLSELDKEIASIEARQGENTYGKALAKIERLFDIQINWRLATRRHIGSLLAELEDQAAFVGAEIRKKVQAMLDTIQAPANDIYKMIQGDRAVPIRLELPPSEGKAQHRLNVLIDFHPNRPGVQPSGYLSDSQIHSVALALRIAAIKRFNAAAPIIALDDVVISYDADHRRAIVGMLAKHCADCQIIITTHDERFFDYLKELLPEKSWHFTHIFKLDPEFGPIFKGYKVSDEVIQDRWSAGESASNEMRRAEEEWLLTICRDFGTSVKIRSLEKPYEYSRSELASALAAFLKGARLTPLPVAGVPTSFLDTLVRGVVENAGSHHQDNPHAGASLGDEQARWKEFVEFRDQFACPKCGRTRFQRSMSATKPTCVKEGCETPFEFQAKPLPVKVA